MQGLTSYTVFQVAKERVLFIPDLHEPYSHPDAFDFILWVASMVKPTVVIFAGDILSQSAHSDFIQDPDGLSAESEYLLAIERLKKWYKRFPKAYLLRGNHDDRYIKQAMKARLGKRFLFPYLSIIEAPKGWKYVDSVMIDGVNYEHGTRFSGQHAAKDAPKINMCSTVFGHLHSSFGIEVVRSLTKTVFGVASACLIDRTSNEFKYARVHKYLDLLGCSAVECGNPQIFMMHTDPKTDRWIGAGKK